MRERWGGRDGREGEGEMGGERVREEGGEGEMGRKRGDGEEEWRGGGGREGYV